MTKLSAQVLAIAHDWDFKNRHGIKHSNGSLPPPEDVRTFLEECSELDNLTLSDMEKMAPSVARLAIAIAEAAARWQERER